MEPLLPAQHLLAPVLEQAHELQRGALRLCAASAPHELRVLLRAMNSYCSNRIEGQPCPSASSTRCTTTVRRTATRHAVNAWRWPTWTQESALTRWIEYVLTLCIDQIRFMPGLLNMDGMKEGIAACLAFEEQAQREGVRSQSLRALHYLWLTRSEIGRREFKAMLGLGDRLATTQVGALLKRGLLATDSPHGKLRFGVPQDALRFYFPRLWPQAEAGAR